MPEIVTAFIAAQKEFPEIKASEPGQEGNREYKYASLPYILKKVYPILHKHGFALTQRLESGTIFTELMHESGDVFVATTGYPTENVTPKDMGKWITYGRRYALVSLLGLAPDVDDDGDGAPPANLPPAPAPPKPTSKAKGSSEFLTAVDGARARGIAALAVIDEVGDAAASFDKRMAKVLGNCGVESANELTARDDQVAFWSALMEMVDALEARAEEVAQAGI